MTKSVEGSTAIVTGASSGIGKVYADRLAARGYDVVLVARREQRLRDIATELADRHRVAADVLVTDLSTADGVRAVSDRITGDGRVTLLVNNAGFSVLRPLTGTGDDVIARMIGLNVTALTQLSRSALIAFQKRPAGTLINVGSGAGFAPYPGIPVYGATKAYVYLFTESLQNEVQDTAVRVQLVLPGAVASEAWDVAGGGDLEPLPEEIVMSAEDCVDAALIGLDRGEMVTAPSLHDGALLSAYQNAGGTLLGAAFNATPAPRYGVQT